MYFTPGIPHNVYVTLNTLTILQHLREPQEVAIYILALEENRRKQQKYSDMYTPIF